MLLTACTTITSKHQYIAVDSNPRNIAVFDENEIFLGKTPFVYELKRKKELRLFLEQDGIKKSYNSSCSFRWGEAGLGNLIFYYFAAIAIPIDLWTGAAYNCADLHTLELKKSEENNPQFCSRYLVLPIFYPKFHLSSEIENSARLSFIKKLKPCDSMVELTESDSLFASLGINHSTEKRRFSQDYYNLWAFETGANQIIDFEVSEQDDKFKIHPKATDFYTLQEKEEEPFYIHKTDLKAYKAEIFNWGAIAVAFIPNSLTTGFGRSTPAFETKNPYQVIKTKQKSLTNNFFLQFSSINSLSSLDQWGLDYGFGISYPFFYDTFSVDIANTETQEINEETWKLFQFSTNFFMEGFIHTPIGAFSLKLGLAPTYYYTKTSESSPEQSFGIGALVAFNYRFFVSRSFFINTEILSATGPDLHQPIISTYIINQINFGVGYILPLRVHHYLVEKI